MRIIEFGLPATFPEAVVPRKAAAFCAEIDGMDLQDATALAQECGYAPIVRRLDHLGENIWGFSMEFDGLNIPFLSTRR